MPHKQNFFQAQFKALGRAELPGSIAIDGRRFQYQEEFKHSFAVAVAVYGLNGEKVVVKLHRQTRFFGLPLQWIGKLMAAHENAVLKHCSGVPGVPRQRKTDISTAVAHDYINGRSLHASEAVDHVFFERLLLLLDRIHKRGVAYVDLEKPENILKGADGRPYFIDFQLAFYWSECKPLGKSSMIRFLRQCLQRCDYYHACKHMKRMQPDLLSEHQQRLVVQKPWAVRAANAVLAPWQLIRKIARR